MINRINKTKETLSIKVININNIEEEFNQCDKLGLYERANLLFN